MLVGANEPVQSPLQVRVAPNPVLDFTQISMTSLAATEAQVSVCNLFGQLLVTRSVNLVTGENLLDFDMSTLPAGSYIIRICGDNAGAAVKVIKG